MNAAQLDTLGSLAAMIIIVYGWTAAYTFAIHGWVLFISPWRDRPWRRT